MRSLLVLALAVGCTAKHHVPDVAAIPEAAAVSEVAAIPATSIPGEACTDLDTNGIAARSTLGGFCCKFCDEGAKTYICCPSKAYAFEGGEDVSASPQLKHTRPSPIPAMHELISVRGRSP